LQNLKQHRMVTAHTSLKDKLDFLSDHDQVLVFFERESTRIAFLRKGFETWSDSGLISEEDCSQRRIRFLILTPETVIFLP
jgi:hypothetical protein